MSTTPYSTDGSTPKRAPKQVPYATCSDEEVYLSDPPSDLDATTKSDDDYEYHPANSESGVSFYSPASVKLQPSVEGDSIGVSIQLPEEGTAAVNGRISSVASPSDSPPAPCPIDVGAILRQALLEEAASAVNVAETPQAKTIRPAVVGLGLSGGLKPLPSRKGIASRHVAKDSAEGKEQAVTGISGNGNAFSSPTKPKGLGLGLPSKGTSSSRTPVPEKKETVQLEVVGEDRVQVTINGKASGVTETSPASVVAQQEAQEEAVEEEEVDAKPVIRPSSSVPSAFGGNQDIAARMEAARAAEAAAMEAAAADPKLQKLRAAVQAHRVTMYRIAARLGVAARSSVLQQALYRLNMAERLQLPRAAVSSGSGLEDAAELSAAKAEENNLGLDFEATVLVIGMKGVGKSATIRTLLHGAEQFDKKKNDSQVYKATTKVTIEQGLVKGLKLTFIDTPGLEPSATASGANVSAVRAIKRAWDRYRPDVLLYVDRLDVCRRDLGELHALRALTEVLGAEAWYSTMLCVTHALATPPDGAAGAPLSTDTYVQSRQQQLLQLVRAVAGDSRMMNPVTLVDNGPACAKTLDGEPVLPPSGTAWRRQLLMLVATTRVLNQASRLLKPERAAARTAAARAGPYGGRSMKVPPMGWLLAKLVEFRSPRKFPEDEREIKRDSEIKKLPPVEKTREMRRRRAFLKQKAEEARSEDSAVPILAPEPALGPSFDPEVNNYRYRVMENPKSMLARPVISETGIDHEDGIDSVQVEKATVLRGQKQYLGGLPILSWVQLAKDKNSLTFQGETDAAYHHSSKWLTAGSINAQSLQRDVLYTARLDSRVRALNGRQKFAVGLLGSKLGEDFTLPIKPGNAAIGLRLDERFRINEAVKVRAAIGRLLVKMGTVYEPGMSLAGDVKLTGAHDSRLLMGASAQWQGRDARTARQSLVIGGNVSGEYRLPRFDGSFFKSDTLVSANCQYTSRGQGTVVVRLSSHDAPQIAVLMVVPVLRALWERVRPAPRQEQHVSMEPY